MKYSFDTAHLKEKLARSTVRGGAAIAFCQMLGFFLGLGSTAVLARLLTPADFGLVAMVLAITHLLAVVQEGGLSHATVQREDLTHEQVSTLFWVNVGLGGAMALLIVMVSPLIALLYQDSRLGPIAVCLALPQLFSGMSVQHQALAKRQLKFWTVEWTLLVGSAIGIVGGIWLALEGAEYWALVALRTISSIVTFALLWIVVPWRPNLPRTAIGVRPMIQFGASISGTKVVTSLTGQADKILVGSLCGAVALGFYSKAYNWLMLPVKKVSGPGNTVAWPALSRLQNDPERYRRYYCQGIALVASLAVPFVTFTAIAAHEMISLLLGPGWEEAALLYQSMAPAAVVQTLAISLGWVTVPLGHGGRLLRCRIADAFVTVAAMLVGIQWGVFGLAIALSASAIIKFLPLNVYAMVGSPVHIADLLKTLFRPLGFCTLSAIGTYLVRSMVVPDGLLCSLALQTLAFAMLYIGLPFLVPRGNELYQPLMNAMQIALRKS